LRVSAEPQLGHAGKAVAATMSSKERPQESQVKSNIGIGLNLSHRGVPGNIYMSTLA
jgi:hypothetical protein